MAPLIPKIGLTKNSPKVDILINLRAVASHPTLHCGESPRYTVSWKTQSLKDNIRPTNWRDGVTAASNIRISAIHRRSENSLTSFGTHLSNIRISAIHRRSENSLTSADIPMRSICGRSWNSTILTGGFCPYMEDLTITWHLTLEIRSILSFRILTSCRKIF